MKLRFPRIGLRKQWIAALLSFPFLGLGYLYAGRPGRAAATLAIYWVAILLFGALGLFASFNGFVAVALVLIVIVIVSIKDTIGIVRWEQQNYPHPYHKWYYYLGFILFSLGINELVLQNKDRVFGIKTYSIPSASMMPTLQRGDNFITDLRHAGQIPERGSVIVFRAPNMRGRTDLRTVLVSRVIGLPGDKVEIRDNRAIVNERPLLEPFAHLPGPKTPQANQAETVVPSNAVFVLGDYRSNSFDSRVFGPVPVKDITGRVTDIYFARKFKRIGMAVN